MYAPLNLSQEHVDIMSPFLPRLKYGLTFIKEQNCIIDLSLTKDKLEILSSTHAPQGGEIDQENLRENVGKTETLTQFSGILIWTQ